MLCLAVFTSGAFAQNYIPVVQELKDMYVNNPAFRTNLDSAFANVVPKPDGSPNPWAGKDIDDMLSFFNNWFSFLPNTSNGLDSIQYFSWFYYKNKYGLNFVRKDPGRAWTKKFVDARAVYMNSPESTDSIGVWMKDPGTHMEEFIIPPNGFQSFNEFFIRRIRPGVRPIDGATDSTVVVSPADALLNMIDSDLTADEKLPIKGRLKLNVEQLLNGSKYADRFIGGTALSCILLPNIYHHYHAPVTGMVIESLENVPGIYFGIEDFPEFFHHGDVGYDADFSVFEQFHRGYYIIDTKGHGLVGMIPVGLNTISSVVFPEKYKKVTDDDPVPVYKGDHLGYFAYGGSLVILLFEPGKFSAVKVLQGQQVGVFNK